MRTPSVDWQRIVCSNRYRTHMRILNLGHLSPIQRQPAILRNTPSTSPHLPVQFSRKPPWTLQLAGSVILLPLPIELDTGNEASPTITPWTHQQMMSRRHPSAGCHHRPSAGGCLYLGADRRHHRPAAGCRRRPSAGSNAPSPPLSHCGRKTL